jgi:hypothetical protein
MRAVFCWLLLIFFAQAVQAQGLSSPTTDRESRHNSAAFNPSNQSDFGHLDFPDPASVQNLDPQTEEKFCAYIRAYRVRREYKGSDVVIPAGQTTCLPSSRFNIRSAVMTQTEPSPGK